MFPYLTSQQKNDAAIASWEGFVFSLGVGWGCNLTSSRLPAAPTCCALFTSCLIAKPSCSHKLSVQKVFDYLLRDEENDSELFSSGDDDLDQITLVE